MSLSNLCFEQHQQDQAKLRKLLLWGFLGSVGVHAIALGISQLDRWPNADATTVSPIELIVTEPMVETPEPEVPAPTQPAALSTKTTDPAPDAQALSPRAAVVTAPRPVSVAEPEAPATAEPEPLAETAVDSELEVSEEEETPVEPQESTAEAEPTEPDLATAPENPSQFDRLRDFFQRQQEGEVANETPADSSPTSAGLPASDAAGAAETTAARPGTGTSDTANPSGGNGQGSRTVACQNCVRPDYPESALNAGAEGQPMVSVDINPDGSVRSVTLTRSSGNPAIDQAAIQAARNSRFQPVSGGASVPIEYDLTIEGSRRNRDARRRGERQAVEVATPPSPTAEASETSPAAASPSPDSSTPQNEAIPTEETEETPASPIPATESDALELTAPEPTPAPATDPTPAVPAPPSQDSPTAAEATPATSATPAPVAPTSSPDPTPPPAAAPPTVTPSPMPAASPASDEDG